MGTPLVEAEQNCAIGVEDLPEVVMGGSRLRKSKQRLIPIEAGMHIANPNDCPGAPNRGATDKAADKEREQWMQRINTENDLASGESKRKEVPTLGDFAKQQWMEYLRHKGVKQSTRDSYGSVLRQHLLPVFENKRLNEIAPGDLSMFLGTLRGKVSTKFTLNIYAQLRVMFEVAVQHDLIEVSPVRDKIHRPKHRASEKPALSAQEIRRLLENVPQNWKAFFVCLALTNVRIGELVALQWSDVDFLNRKLRINKSVWRGKLVDSTKTGAALLKHVPDPLLGVLQWHRQISTFTGDSDFIFAKLDGTPCDPNFVRDSVLYPAMDRAGIQRGVRTHGFHIFRHSAGSIVHKRTGSMKLAQTHLGHADMGTTANIYVHVDQEQVRQAAEVLAEEIGLSFCPPNAHQTAIICPPKEAEA